MKPGSSGTLLNHSTDRVKIEIGPTVSLDLDELPGENVKIPKSGRLNSPTKGFPQMDPPSNFSYEMGRTWATVQIASQDFFVQTGGVVPPILYLESFCS